MNIFSLAIDFVLHSDRYLAEFIALYGVWIYPFIFLIVFCETGLVVTPILPGDSMIFALGALASLGQLEPPLIAVTLFCAALCGDNVNYFIGRRIGPAIFKKENSRFFKRAYLERTQAFYEKYGAITVVAARFMPIVRTFSPFVAGIGKMRYVKFLAFSIGGAALWVSLFLSLGYFFGSLPIVKQNFTIAIMAIVLLSITPPIIAALRSRKARTSSST